jgi:hypothetical protein
MKTNNEKGEGGNPHNVTITINNVKYEVKPGNHPVAQLKNTANPKIPQDETLCMFIDGEFKPLDDKVHVDIKGGEIFASNCQSGGAS